MVEPGFILSLTIVPELVTNTLIHLLLLIYGACQHQLASVNYRRHHFHRSPYLLLNVTQIVKSMQWKLSKQLSSVSNDKTHGLILWRQYPFSFLKKTSSLDLLLKNYRLIWEREREREKERERSVLLIYVFSCWFLYVSWPGIEPTTMRLSG